MLADGAWYAKHADSWRGHRWDGSRPVPLSLVYLRAAAPAADPGRMVNE